MRILLLSANTGEGHNSCAKAVMEVLEAEKVQCDLEDALACLSPGFSKFVCDWHSRIYKYGGKIFDVGYRFFEFTANPYDFNPLYELLSLGAGKLRDLIMERDYDAVVCTHPFSATMVSEVRRSWNLELPCFFVATDYTCSPTVEQCCLDLYFIPAPELTEEFVRAGISEQRLAPSGIPVRQAFYQTGNRAQLRDKLALPQENTVILLMGGSMGCGPIRKVAEGILSRVPENVTMVCICGRNEKLFEELSSVEDPRMRVQGFTANMDEFMEAADFIITKPGGLSSTEAANKHLPLVFINTVGGCESRNFDFYVRQGYALGSDDPEKVVEDAVRLTLEPQLRQQMRGMLAKNFTTNSAYSIARYVIRQAKTYRSGMAQAIAKELED